MKKTSNITGTTILFISLLFPVLVFAQEQGTVSRVIDGDTLKVEIDGVTETVRIIGIDTPETVHPSKPVECFGKEASNKLKGLLEEETVKFDVNPAEDRDRYDRLLRYVEKDGEDVGAQMIEDGYAYSYKKYPHPRLEKYNDLERKARESEKGLWGACSKENGEFSDVSSSHPYIAAIRWGKESGVLSGYPDGTFQPDRTVNRAEFLKIVLAAQEVDVGAVTTPTEFWDIDESAWYTPYLRYAKHTGIIQ